MNVRCRSVLTLLLLGIGCARESPMPEYDSSLIVRATGVVFSTPAGRYNVSVAAVPNGFFGDERWAPILGRLFSPEEHMEGGQAVAILSHGFWTQLGERPGMVGSTVLVGETERVVVGVLPEGAGAVEQVQIWVPR